MYLFLHLHIIVSTVNLGDVYTAQCETVGSHVHGFKFTVCKIFTARPRFKLTSVDCKVQ